MAIHLLGIRHHGPGSSKNILDALATIKPDIILIEGPPEGENMLQWVQHPEIKPPVALLTYVPQNPQQAVFYPFTDYSPEWNAIKFALQNNITVRFIDMPLSNKFALKNEDPVIIKLEDTASENKEAEQPQETQSELIEKIKKNPISYLSEIAGFDDEEEWWEHQFELNQYSTEVFVAIAEFMTALRESFPVTDKTELIREAFMRNAIRVALKEQKENIVVVCGAWHVPALQNFPTQKEDDHLLKNLPKIKVESTWIPWTNNRMSFDSGYGAGVNSPGWYQHLWDFPHDDGTRWLSLTAGVFRNHKIDISSAHIIESVRLCKALASLRDLFQPGLKEYLEATQTVMCLGDSILMKLVWKDLIVGSNFGTVPAEAPKAPLQSDFEQQAKSLRLKISDEAKLITLDLRENFDLEKSIFIHRMLLLDVNWATSTSSKSKGTFKEEWILCWDPEFTIHLLEKVAWGNTISTAAERYLINKAETCTNLVEMTMLIQKAIPAELTEGIKATMKKLDELSAASSDTQQLMDTFIPLVQIYKYGNVRNTDISAIDIIMRSVFYRILAGLPFSTTNLNEETAAEMAVRIRKIQESILILDEAEYKSDWLESLVIISEIEQTEAIIQGSCFKLLYDQKIISEAQTATAFYRSLSSNNSPEYSAQWLEGFLADGATILLFDDTIWHIIDVWLNSLEEENFLKIIPLLRRTFAEFTSAEKRKIAQRALKNVSAAVVKESVKSNLNNVRGEKVLNAITQLLFIKEEQQN